EALAHGLDALGHHRVEADPHLMVARLLGHALRQRHRIAADPAEAALGLGALGVDEDTHQPCFSWIACRRSARTWSARTWRMGLGMARARATAGSKAC